MAREEPLLNEPAPGWKRDLSSPNERPLVLPVSSWLPTPPNHMDDAYLELSRHTLRVPGVGMLIGGLFLALVLTFLSLTVFSGLPPVELAPVLLLLILTALWAGIYMIRMDVEPPCDEPIRFNRLRRKVYVYRFHHDWLRPFSRKAWGVRPAEYNWDDLHAEACSVYGPMGTGGLIENITLTVLKPGTHEVLDRFIFAHDIDHGEQYWAMAQLFMQQGPQALPTFPHPPRDWNNEPANFNLARRFAPKVQWPDEMDLESRTAPNASAEPILAKEN